MYETVLVPTDGSPAMETVLEHASDVAARREAAVRVLYVVDDRAFLTMDDTRVPEVTEHLHEEGVRAVADAGATLEAEGLAVSTEIREGDPAEVIVAAIEDHGAGLVVMGTHGTDPEHNLLGSTARTVVTESPVPVLAVPVSGRDPATERADD